MKTVLKKLTILGEPNAQKRHRHVNRGAFVQTYDPSVKEKQDYRIVAQQEAPATPFSVPLFVEVDCYFSRPKSHYGSGRNAAVVKQSSPVMHTKKPDADNCIKFVFDALNGLFWTDDAIICGHSIWKRFSEKPRTEITIYSVDEFLC